MLAIMENRYFQPLVVSHPVLPEHQSMPQVKDTSADSGSHAINTGLKGHGESLPCDICVAVIVVPCHCFVIVFIVIVVIVLLWLLLGLREDMHVWGRI